jgi:hypothetical protein
LGGSFKEMKKKERVSEGQKDPTHRTVHYRTSSHAENTKTVSKRMVRALRAMGLRLPCGDVGQSTWVPQSPECGEQATGHWLLGVQRVSHDPELRPALRERVILG